MSSYPGFSRESGPHSRRPNAVPPFGAQPSQQPQRGASPVSHPFARSFVSPPNFESRGPEALGRMQSPPLSYENSLPAFPSSGGPRPQESFPIRPTYKDYDTQSNQHPSIVTSLVASRSHGASVTAKVTRHQDLKQVNIPLQYAEKDSLQSTYGNVVSNHLVARARSPLSYEDVYATYDNSSSEELQRYPGVQIGMSNGMVSQTPRLSHASHENFYSTQEARLQEIQRSAPSSTFSAWNLRPKSPSHYASPIAAKSLNLASPHSSSQSSRGNSPAGPVVGETLIGNKSLPLSQVNNVTWGSYSTGENNKERPSGYLPLSKMTSEVGLSDCSSSAHQSASSCGHILDEAHVSKPNSFPVPKRMRSPPSSLSDQESQQSYFTGEDIERENFAKAKRLARFKVELSEPEVGQDKSIAPNPKGFSGGHAASEEQEVNGKDLTELSRDFPNILSDLEFWESSGTIIGVCPDMCPESERGERERKGDLDQYERVDGDRNQTSKFLAVKKYNRTAEREASLIRPMPVLLKTVDHLLNLLNQPYDERFLGLYNFLWDRMRAVRMDLRMQHIFDLEAIRMLEQMIRLHIIAMHELCEYAKGEGFSEGFDAHLNIEQMNKTSAELFQLYDDHRKRGINVPTEKEFRGYYALLKLDKHPGYKVEPAELSLDLTKMTQEIRQTPEVRFARDVARACRTGNFISFFRLSRKATYLQACLMHPHFSKLRSQALASLHSGLQGNQGLPVAVVAGWLAMEEEDIGSLLEYYGFSIKEFEEPYMVKEGPFLVDEDFPTKQSKLVHLKRSSKIIDDVLSSQAVYSPSQEATRNVLSNRHGPENVATQFVGMRKFAEETDGEMGDSVITPQLPQTPVVAIQREAAGAILGTGPVNWKFPVASSSPKANRAVPGTGPFNWKFPVASSSPQVDDAVPGTSPVNWKLPAATSSPKADRTVPGTGLANWKFPIANSSPKPQQSISVEQSDWNLRKPSEMEKPIGRNAISLQSPSRRAQPKMLPVVSGSHVKSSAPSAEGLTVMDEDIISLQHQDRGPYNYEETDVNNEDKEVAESKLKLILRLWKRRSARRRELRQQRNMAAAVALSSLSLGPKIQWNKDENGSSDKLQIDYVMRERFDRREDSWSKLNVADLAAGILSSRNARAKCLCWKIIFSSHPTILENDLEGKKLHTADVAAARWLREKLMPVMEEDHDLVFKSQDVSIWRKWITGYLSTDLACCLSVIKDVNYDSLEESVAGTSAILFLVTQDISFDIQKNQLHRLLISLPSGSHLPLLILVDSSMIGGSDAATAIATNLGLHEIDRSRISALSLICLFENEPVEGMEGFFSDQRLREGLQWLASESPLPPVVHRVQTRELVLNHLNRSFLELEQGDSESSPNDFIIAVNYALDQSLTKVIAAAVSNRVNWPCPEIALLDKVSDECGIANSCLPCIGWSTSTRIEALKAALGKCRLPLCDDDLSGLKRGGALEKEVVNQKLQLENFLVGYLTEKCNIMGSEMARTEVSMMLQKYVRLEFRSSHYFLIPSWDTIFRRIINWRLMTLSAKEVAETYILEEDDLAPPLTSFNKVVQDGAFCQSLEYPSLDEMLEVGCSSQLAFSVPTVRTSCDNGQCEASQATDFDYSEAPSELAISNDGAHLNGKLNDTEKQFVLCVAGKETDTLSRLLQQCNILQNAIDEKLSLYF